MTAAWMVTINGYLLAFVAVLAVAGCLLVGLVIHDEVVDARSRRVERERRAAKRKDASR